MRTRRDVTEGPLPAENLIRPIAHPTPTEKGIRNLRALAAVWLRLIGTRHYTAEDWETAVARLGPQFCPRDAPAELVFYMRATCGIKNDGDFP